MLKLRGSLEISGDKSISHRALILSAMTTGKTKITNLLESEDVMRTLKILKKLGVNSVAICANDAKNYPEDSFENMIKFSEINNFNFPYLHDENQEVAKLYNAVCTPDFFGYNSKLELQYRGRFRELKDLKPVKNGQSDLMLAMQEILKTGKGPKNQIPSMGCNIKWK